MSRESFRRQCVERDGGECLVPSCEATVTAEPSEAGEVHHIIERKLWQDGGYIPENGACVCNKHHRYAEENVIPPQAFWRWIGVENPPLPEDPVGREAVMDSDVDKWGKPLPSPAWQEHREYIKYPSSRHLPWSHERDDDDTAHQVVDWALEIPLVATIKMDGGNAMLVKDTENPVRARNGRHADREHFDMAKQWYWDNNLYSKIPEHLQVFGEWLYAKHSIHYKCQCNTTCEDIGPPLRDYFQVFAMYDTRYNLWLGWHETLELANEMGLTVVPVVEDSIVYDNTREAWDDLWEKSQDAVEQGHEGIVVRSEHPFHYGSINKRLGKYVRPNHVKDDEKHWSKRPLVKNGLRDDQKI